MRYITFSWDDGFRASSLLTAEIFESFGLRTEFNILTDWSDAASQDSEFGDWRFWNELKARGHFIHPHGTNHTDKARIPFAEAQRLVLKSLEIFRQKLSGFDARQAIFALPYLATTPELNAWFPSVVRAYRPAGIPINPLPGPHTVHINTGGDEDCQPWVSEKVEQLLQLDAGWLVLCLHGLNGEGWGPMQAEYLINLLKKITSKPAAQVLPAIEVLNLFQKY
jgi:hypothetical protein